MTVVIYLSVHNFLSQKLSQHIQTDLELKFSE